jgi:dimethylargininase
VNVPGPIAFVREPSESLARCELTHLARTPIDFELAKKQHSAYVAALSELGARLEWLPKLPEHPDAVFVEDTAVLISDMAIVTRPGASERRGEVESVATALRAHREVRRIEAPARLDGGDVLVIGRSVFVGLSTRTNVEAVTALRELLGTAFTVIGVPLAACLHLKSACSFIPPDLIVANSAWIDPKMFAPLRIIETEVGEPAAANTLTLRDCTLVSASAVRTEQKLRRAGVSTRALDISEFEKAEAALTCMSLIAS